MKPEQMPAPEAHEAGVNERADAFVGHLLHDFAAANLDRIRRNERGLVEQELVALTDRTIGELAQTEGKEFARAVAHRITDEIEFCSATFAEYANIVKAAVAEAEEKYGIGSSPTNLDEAS